MIDLAATNRHRLKPVLPKKWHTPARHALMGFWMVEKLFVLSSPAGEKMRKPATNCYAWVAAWMFVALLLAATPAAAQKNKNKKVSATDSSAVSDLRSSLPPVPDSQAIDQAVGEMLGYWQIGDIDMLHKYYADDVLMVSGAWEPPVVGWDSFVKSYQAQRASVTGERIERSNTYIKANGSSAWVTYQFLYDAVASDGKIIQFRGHTTLVLNKTADRWVIALNHSSIVDSSTGGPSTPAVSAPPGGDR
jgi:ketosteroid isomerase-like protein